MDDQSMLGKVIPIGAPEPLSGRPRCPHCNGEARGVCAIGDAAPMPVDGQLSICGNCLAVAAFTVAGEAVGLRLLTQEESDAVSANAEIQLLLNGYRAIKMHAEIAGGLR